MEQKKKTNKVRNCAYNSVSDLFSAYNFIITTCLQGAGTDISFFGKSFDSHINKL
jgi:hypothetical protein